MRRSWLPLWSGSSRSTKDTKEDKPGSLNMDKDYLTTEDDEETTVYEEATEEIYWPRRDVTPLAGLETVEPAPYLPSSDDPLSGYGAPIGIEYEAHSGGES